eukprot:TRINITY_DN6498_c0_g1_i1.p1 TRINITY_DN6498_c0_g1~~TRINITY_DN6498_c0_g1_i1.p1  ORF type:complete len:599 (-),score=144.85 TRINITY_DN6498_c0_g1_i1:175-1971(-)
MSLSTSNSSPSLNISISQPVSSSSPASPRSNHNPSHFHSTPTMLPHTSSQSSLGNAHVSKDGHRESVKEKSIPKNPNYVSIYTKPPPKETRVSRIVRLLLENGIDIHISSLEAKTALDLLQERAEKSEVFELFHLIIELSNIPKPGSPCASPTSSMYGIHFPYVSSSSLSSLSPPASPRAEQTEPEPERKEEDESYKKAFNERVREINFMPLIVPVHGYKVDLGDSSFKSLEHSLIDPFPDLYRKFFYKERHLNFVGYSSIKANSSQEPVIITVQEAIRIDSKKNTYHRALFRTQAGSQEIQLPTNAIDTVPTYSRILSDLQNYSPGSRLQLVEDAKLADELLEYEEKDPQKTFNIPIGVVFAKEGQTTASEMWDNEHGSTAFNEFMDFLGEKITLEGWKNYAGGLDVKNNTKGKTSYYRRWGPYQIMFHVSTLLPYAPEDPQKLQRSRVIGNDVTNIIFMDGGTPYLPTTMTGAVSHVFVVIQPYSIQGRDLYRMGTCSYQFVPPFRPGIPSPNYFEKNDKFRSFLLAKLINGHFAAQSSVGLSKMYTRPRREMIEDLIKRYWSPEKDTGLLKSIKGMMSPRVQKDAGVVQGSKEIE